MAMLFEIWLWICTIILSIVTCRGAAVPEQTKSWIPSFMNLVAFGDSYTDETRLGYFTSHKGQAPPPGYLPPSSTRTAGGGVTWARVVSINTSAKLYNYAVAGAVCDNKIVNRYVPILNGPFPDVVYEVNAFVADSKYIDPATNTSFYTNRYSDNTVYSMWIGTNDFGVGGFLTDSNLNGSTITTYVDCIFEKFDQIYATGGRYFVLMNLAPLELSPLYGMPNAGGLPKSSYWGDKPSNTSEVSGKIREYTKIVNALFDSRVPYELDVAKRYPNASIAIFDTNTLITDIYNTPNNYLTPPANPNQQYFKCEPVIGGNCTTRPEGLDHYLWFDELHPSAKTDEVIAGEFSNLLQGKSKYAKYWK
ncbi:Acetylesterase [Golovinomyces cichoracearum]|uniref:Acetylesterase n=1 Tax=Golovinomyces cichoracearum TaxID=62708 RepID=A0A420J7W0_9PEZI|nr:Acetylesterase [Golovinomyces cichoracearum]